MELAAAGLVAALGLGACAGGESPRRSALLLSLDTTRADALSCYGGGAATPNLDRLAREGILFERAHTVVPITLPAHASMLTGLIPLRHGLRDNGAAALPESATTLAELARARGVQTAAFVASIVLAPAFGLDQGFEVYGSPGREEGSDEARALHGGERRAGKQVDLALAWLEGRDRSRPFFLWVHFYDPHAPYDPPPGTEGSDPYLGEVAAMDREIGRLFAGLEADGALDETTILAIADHGEAFGEHGERTHAAYCYEPTLAVPFLLRLPDGRRAGERSRAVVSVVDVFPTLAGAMGLDPGPGGLDGSNLLGAIDTERSIYFESYYGYITHGWSPLAGTVDARWKYIHSSEPELFDLDVDPAEEHNLVASAPERAARLRESLAGFDELEKLSASDAAIDADLIANIQALGYSGMAGENAVLPAPAKGSALPSPRSQSSWFDAYERAQGLRRAGRLDEAAAVFESVLRTNPADYQAIEELAGIRYGQGRVAEALAGFRRLTESGPGRARHFYSLGLCLSATGDLEGARAAIAHAVEMAPNRPAYARTLRKLEARLGG